MAEDKEIASTNGAWLRLLALDGGGVRGLSSLMVLQQLMEVIDPNSPPKPCEYFHMIGGTSTGGLIAIMLGRLRMTVEECIAAYTTLSSKVFEKQRHRVSLKGDVQGRFDAGALEQAVKQILVQQGLSENALLKDSPNAACKVFVCATSKHTADTVCLSSYQSPRGDNHLFNSIKIWEACRATFAATSFFDPIAIGPFGKGFVDGALGANNPIYAVWNQAQDLWSGGSLQDKLLCLVSIGTGVLSIKPFPDDVLKIGRTLIALATEAEQTAEQFHRDKAALDDESNYYRFNVSQGLEDIGLEESTKTNEIAAATFRYITSPAVFRQIKGCAKKLSGQGHFITNRIAFSIESVPAISALGTDPITLTTSVLVAVTQATDTLRSCQKYAAQFKIADLFIASLHMECSAIRLRLHQIKSLITRDGENPLETRYEAYVLEEYDDALQACYLPFSILNKHLENLGLTQMKGMNQSAFTTKLQFVSSHQQMDMVSQNIRSLARAINILYTAFQSETAIKTSEIMRSPEAKEVLATVSNDAISLHESFQTVPGIEESTTSSMIGDEEFGFDNALLNTTLYQRAFARQVIKSQHRESQDHDGKEETDFPMETEAVGTSFSEAPLEPRIPLRPGLNTLFSHSPSTREPIVLFTEGPESKPDEKLESVFETAPSNQESYLTNLYSLDDTWATSSQKNLTKTAVEQIQSLEDCDPPIPERLPSLAAVRYGETPADVIDPMRLAIKESAAQRERQNSVDSQLSTDTIPASAISGVTDKSMLDRAHEMRLDSASVFSRKEDSLDPALSSGLAGDSAYTSPLSPSPVKLSRLPTLFEVLYRKTSKPYTLFEFYLYMRDIQRSVDYLDFWLDVSQHLSLCRQYVRELRSSILVGNGNNEEEVFSVVARNEEHNLVARGDIRASAEKILYTYLLQGSEREIVLPHSMTQDIVTAIEEFGRDDPEVFDVAKDYVFQAMERDAFPGFLNLSRPLFRVFRRSKSLGPLVNRLYRKDHYVTTTYSQGIDMQRIRPEDLFGQLGKGHPGGPL